MTAVTVHFSQVSTDIVVNQTRRPHLRDVTLSLPRRRIALLASDPHDGQGVIDLLCRKIIPVSGNVNFEGAVSWPIGRFGSFAGAVKGTDTISHICALYGVDRRLALDFMVEQFEEPERLPTRMDRWPPALRARFALLTGLIPQFDIYLIEGNLIHLDEPAFTQGFLELLAERVGGRTLVISTRQTRLIQAVCDCAAVVADRTIRIYDDLDAAQKVLAGATPVTDEVVVDPEVRREEFDEPLI